MSDPGPHLLGRLPTTPDARDFTVAMVIEATPLELAYQRLLAARGANKAVKDWAGEVMKRLAGIDPPIPQPPAPPVDIDVIWALPDPVLDQGETSHCGGFGGAQWGNLEPVTDHYRAPDGHALYYESVAIGGEPGTEDGVESRWVAQALQARGKIATYAFARDAQEIIDWVRTMGPVMMGTDWTHGMFSPDASGLATVSGQVEGGHFWCVCGDLPGVDQVLCLNSWGDTWGAGGYFKLTYADLVILLTGIEWPGDAIVSPEPRAVIASGLYISGGLLVVILIAVLLYLALRR